MFKALRISILLLILFFVSMSTWLTKARSTNWNNSLWVKVYPINADGSDQSQRYIDSLSVADFAEIESFVKREIEKYGHTLAKPVRLELGTEIYEQPPAIADDPGVLDIVYWSLRMRWWAGNVAGPQDSPKPDVRIFVRYHTLTSEQLLLENSVGLQKGMVGVVNAYAGRRHAGLNNVIIAHEFLHTLGATDKYNPETGFPNYPLGFAEPEQQPRYPQRLAEVMGGRIARTESYADTPKNLKTVIIGATTAEEIGLLD